MRDSDLRDLDRAATLAPDDVGAQVRFAVAEFRVGIDPVGDWVDERLRARWPAELPEDGPSPELLKELDENKDILRAIVRLGVSSEHDYVRGPRGLMVARIGHTLVIGVMARRFGSHVSNPAESWGVSPWRAWAEEKLEVSDIIAEPVVFHFPKPRGMVKSLDARTEYDRHINRVRQAICSTPRPDSLTSLRERTAFPLERARLFAGLAPLAA